MTGILELLLLLKLGGEIGFLATWRNRRLAAKVKAGGKGVRIDGSGTTEDSIEVFHLRPGHVPPG